jgi:beta-glucosidase
LLRNELGFTGVAVTDWEDVYKLVDVHRVAKDKKEAVKIAVMAGIDMSMTPNDFEFTSLLVELVKEGSIPESRLDLSVRRILQLKKDLGLFDNVRYPITQYPLFGSAQHAQASLELAKESITLLKNVDKVLPIQTGEKVFVCGPAANSLNLLNGAWTHTWQGVDTQYNTKNKPTILEALQGEQDIEVDFALGAGLDTLHEIQKCIRKS